MPHYFSLFWSLIFLALCAYLIWLWIRLPKSVRETAPKWRVVSVAVGLLLVTASTGLSDFLFVHAAYTGGYTFYHPVELFCIRIGTLTALLGLVAALAGKGKLKIHIAAISLLNLLSWFADAMAQ